VYQGQALKDHHHLMMMTMMMLSPVGIDRASHAKKDNVKDDFFSLQALAENLMLFFRPPKNMRFSGIQAVYLQSIQYSKVYCYVFPSY